MSRSSRYQAPRARALLLVLSLAGSLSGCLGAGQSRLADLSPRPDPPPVPLRKPTPPAHVMAALAEIQPVTQAVTQAVTQPVAQAMTPAPVTTASLAPAPPHGARAKPTVATVTYRIKAGDTVYGVARRFAVPVRGVIDQNRLGPPYALRVGQILRIPNPRRHVVRPGDTIYGVARRYGADPSQLVRLNAISPPYTISPGQDLILPAHMCRSTT